MARPRNQPRELAQRTAIRWHSLRDLMRTRNVTIEQLSETIGVRSRTVENYLYGEFAPTAARLRLIVRALSGADPGTPQYMTVAKKLMADQPESLRSLRAQAAEKTDGDGASFFPNK